MSSRSCSAAGFHLTFAGILLAVLTALTAVPSPASAAEPRLARSALVIGNQQYRHWKSLQTPRSDAGAIAASLRTLGYETELLLDATREQMLNATAALAKKLKVPHHSVVFYYAGHGVQIEGLNYLVPVDMPTSATRAVDGLAPMSELMKPFLGADINIAKIILLDACRDNPLGTRPGLAQPSVVPDNALIGYATTPDRKAEDGDWTYAPYTKALLQELGRVGQNLDDTMTHVRNFVVAMTDRDQTPWLFKSMPKEFYFRDPVTATVSLQDVDDAGIVTLNGNEIASSAGRANEVVRLAPGRNELAVMIYNQKTYTGGNPWWGLAEGWRFWLSITLPPSTTVTSTPALSDLCGLTNDRQTMLFRAREDQPPRHGNRHGGLFTATRAVLEVDDTGQVRLVSADCNAWRH